MLTLDEVGRRLAWVTSHELNVIVKGDVDGSVEALSDSLIKLSTDRFRLMLSIKALDRFPNQMFHWLLHRMQSSSCFQVRPSNAAKLAEHEGVDIRILLFTMLSKK